MRKLSEIENLSDAVGLRVRASRGFAGVGIHAEGVVDDHYRMGTHEGVMVAWDLESNPLPAGYRRWDGRPMLATGILRDGFGRDERFDETEMLEIVE